MSNSVIPADQINCPVGEASCIVIEHLQEARTALAKLDEEVRTDSLTGLYNFRHFQQALAQEMERTRRVGHSMALMMVDLDFFKKVNDSWGHEVGNQALKSTAKILKNMTRQLDIACRYGGEEFAVILPATEPAMALQVAERVRKTVESTSVMADKEDIGLTASIGVAFYDAMNALTENAFIDAADQCLYRAKNQGRNCVVMDVQKAENHAVSFDEREALIGLFGNDNYDGDIEDE